MLKILTFFICLLSFNIFAKNSIEKLNETLKNLNSHEISLYQEVSSQLKCPTCTGLSVLESEAMFSIQIRTKVAELIASGLEEKAIMEFFESRYGLWIFRKPPTKGFHIIAWITPLLAFILGGFALWWAFWRKRKIAPQASKTSLDTQFLQALRDYQKSKEN